MFKRSNSSRSEDGLKGLNEEDPEHRPVRKRQRGWNWKGLLPLGGFIAVYLYWNQISLSLLENTLSQQRIHKDPDEFQLARELGIDGEFRFDSFASSTTQQGSIERQETPEEQQRNQLDEEGEDEVSGEIEEEEIVEENTKDQVIQTGFVSREVNSVEVCTVAKNPRQGSIFRTNLMSSIGSGRYSYRVQAAGTCPWNVPRVRMVPYVKCCTQLSAVYKTLAASFDTYDIIIVTGDEYCAVKNQAGFHHYRQYHGDSVIETTQERTLGRKVPFFFPLGPRGEFNRVAPTEVIPAKQRKYDVNFVGSPTSVPRRALRDYFNSAAWATSKLASKSFVHITDGWTQKVDLKKGYISPGDYRNVLLQSRFTLCPIGHNPEAYRIYEACEAGSIPILTIGEPTYLEHKCSNAYKPFLDAKAPFIFLKTWDELGGFIEMAEKNATFVEERQQMVRKWYKSYMNSVALQFERILEERFQARMRKPKPARGK